eukprot:CAMPEP_0181318360 /NCGR_PEP_ID=MMETSP1101-20121128/16963_1 /TAXON_ID=46948 /ORGANISM="Rhodomonas abbreviata, Strain Caron Lab Isolate" /LENGTH=149 /DNA_ID=CAMNT_0023425821 /DNA_START=328 /DNA_END=777 /DNA_ORIENTATION=+
MAPDPLELEDPLGPLGDLGSFEMRLSKDEIATIRTELYLDSCDDASDDDNDGIFDSDESMGNTTPVASDDMQGTPSKRWRLYQDQDDDTLSLSSTPEMQSHLGMMVQEKQKHSFEDVSGRQEKRLKSSIMIAGTGHTDERTMNKSSLCF